MLWSLSKSPGIAPSLVRSERLEVTDAYDGGDVAVHYHVLMLASMDGGARFASLLDFSALRGRQLPGPPRALTLPLPSVAGSARPGGGFFRSVQNQGIDFHLHDAAVAGGIGRRLTAHRARSGRFQSFRVLRGPESVSSVDETGKAMQKQRI